MSYYTVTITKLREFLNTIKKVKPPEPKASQEWLNMLGYKSKNHRVFIPILQQIGFLDGNKVPTELYQKFRVARTSRQVMAEGLRKGYSLLWEVFDDPQNASAEELKDIFKSTGMSDEISRRCDATFRMLVEFSDLGVRKAEEVGISQPHPTAAEKSPLPVTQTLTLTPEQAGTLFTQKRELGVNINIQLTLPETTDAGVYDKIFEALKKHFFSE